MDQYLLLSVDWNLNSDWDIVVEELKGQFSWLVGTLLIRQAQVVSNFNFLYIYKDSG